jgi:hypothetical protein
MKKRKLQDLAINKEEVDDSHVVLSAVENPLELNDGVGSA